MSTDHEYKAGWLGRVANRNCSVCGKPRGAHYRPSAGSVSTYGGGFGGYGDSTYVMPDVDPAVDTSSFGETSEVSPRFEMPSFSMPSVSLPSLQDASDRMAGLLSSASEAMAHPTEVSHGDTGGGGGSGGYSSGSSYDSGSSSSSSSYSDSGSSSSSDSGSSSSGSSDF